MSPDHSSRPEPPRQPSHSNGQTPYSADVQHQQRRRKRTDWSELAPRQHQAAADLCSFWEKVVQLRRKLVEDAATSSEGRVALDRLDAALVDYEEKRVKPLQMEIAHHLGPVVVGARDALQGAIRPMLGLEKDPARYRKALCEEAATTQGHCVARGLDYSKARYTFGDPLPPQLERAWLTAVAESCGVNVATLYDAMRSEEVQRARATDSAKRVGKAETRQGPAVIAEVILRKLNLISSRTILGDKRRELNAEQSSLPRAIDGQSLRADWKPERLVVFLDDVVDALHIMRHRGVAFEGLHRWERERVLDAGVHDRERRAGRSRSRFPEDDPGSSAAPQMLDLRTTAVAMRAPEVEETLDRKGLEAAALVVVALLGIAGCNTSIAVLKKQARSGRPGCREFLESLSHRGTGSASVHKRETAGSPNLPVRQGRK